jgi:tyrosyl-tRNA synthetase
MPFDEFAYALMQTWDWWELFKKGAQVQIGGADQFGNILTGIEGIKAMKKVEPVHFEDDAQFQGHVSSSFVQSPSTPPKGSENLNEPIGFTVPLLTTSAGVKFGKSEGNAVWIDPDMTSTFDQYKFFLRCADADVERYLKLFTFVPIPEIREIMEEHRTDESKRIAQHRLAFEFIELMHGLGAATNVQQQHKQLFEGKISIDSLRGDSRGKQEPSGDWNSILNPNAKAATAENTSSVHLTLPRSLVVGQNISKVLWHAGMVSSKGEGFRLIASKGCQVGSKTGRGAATDTMGDSLAFTIATNPATDTLDYLIDGDLLILKIGKWKMKIVRTVSDEEYEKSGLTCPGWKELEEARARKEDWEGGAKGELAIGTQKRPYRGVGV